MSRAAFGGRGDTSPLHRSVHTRCAAEADLRVVRQIAAAAFPLPAGWTDDEANCRHYDLRWLSAHAGAGVALVLVERAHRPVGYVYWQLRNDHDCYIKELAVDPACKRASDVPLGTLLLACVVEAARHAGSDRLTANILEGHRQSAPLWRDPLPFYARFGFEVRCEAGYTVDGSPRPGGDTWIVADPRRARRRLRRRLLTSAAALDGFRCFRLVC
jgi:GNAT superfamily N-acetyltransferase